MRHTGVHTVGAMRVIVAAVAVAAILPAAVQAGPAPPRLRIADSAPLAIRGVGFGAHEKVRLTVTLGATTQLRKLYTDRQGTFFARFADLKYDRCHGALKVAAVGARGHTSSFELQPLECPNSGTS